MTLQASGAISLGQVNVEFGLPSGNQLDLLHAWIRILVNKPSGAIKLSDLYSKTAHFTGNITVSSSNQSVGLNASFFGAVTNTMLRNASNGNIEMDFNSAPLWQGNIFLVNNTTGVSSTLTRQNTVSWQGANPANLWRASTADNFTFRPI